ncbi:DUF2306 domain-containing protein [Tenacibaculum sp. 190524A05c]|uniref:TPR_REGION domain-containing protein n=1 Tax=Tenacibaculum platacis TaxID=3137852 RepID=A0ABP1ESK7_9FLAO
MKRLIGVALISFCLFIGITRPLKYLLADGPIDLLAMKPEEVLNSLTYKIAFYIHIITGGIALLIGWIQFVKRIRTKFPKLHRTIGKVYVGSILISSPFAFYISFFVRGGLPTEIGFTFGSLIWVTATYLGYRAIRKGNLAGHIEYITYSYAGTFAAVTLRLWLPLLISYFGNFNIAYGISVWLSWIPNVLIAYLIIHKKENMLYYYKKYRIEAVLKGTAGIVLVFFMLSYTSVQTWFYKKPSFEGTALERQNNLSNSYFSKEKFTEIEEYLKEESETTSMIVLENGKVVYEYGDVSEIYNIKDSKTGIISLLLGKYLKEQDLNTTIESNNINEYYGLLPIEKNAKIKHLLTSTSGVFYLKNERAYYTNRTIRERGKVEPGEYFMFNNWDYNVASYLLEKESGNSFAKELEDQLAIPIGFEDWNIANQKVVFNKKKSKFGTQEIHISTRDMAKIGQLLLQKGSWNGKQIISKDWIEKTTSTSIPMDTLNSRIGRDTSSPLQQSYGYLWWLFERFYDNPDFEGAFTSWDESGQFITVIPKRNVVVAHKTKLDYLTHTQLSERTKLPSWKYWWILRKLMLNRKSIAEFAKEETLEEVIEFIKTKYNKESEYAISERLINEYALSLAEENKNEDAVKFYELNLQLYPGRGYYTHRIYNYLGQSLFALDRKKEALKAFENSLEWNSDNPTATKMIKELKSYSN